MLRWCNRQRVQFPIGFKVLDVVDGVGCGLLLANLYH